MKEEDKIAREAKDVLTGRKPIAVYKDQTVLRIFVKHDDTRKLGKFCDGVKDYLGGGIEGFRAVYNIVTIEEENIGIIEMQSKDKFDIMLDRWKCLCKYMNIPEEITDI